MRPIGVNAGANVGAADALRAAGRVVVEVPDGAALDALVRAGGVAGVLDLWLADLAAGAGPNRLTAASALGVPQVVAPGGLPESLTAEAADRLGLDVAQKVSAASGPAAVLLPLVGLTPALAVFNQSVRNWAYGFELVELELAVTDPGFGAAAAGLLLRLLPPAC
jgi:uncharacterized protein (UPF0261 family)